MLYINEPYETIGAFSGEGDFILIRQGDEQFVVQGLDAETGTFRSIQEFGKEVVPIWTSPMGKAQQERFMAEEDSIKGRILVDVYELICSDEGAFLDLISNRLIGNPCLCDIRYTVVGVTEPDTLLIEVAGYLDM